MIYILMVYLLLLSIGDIRRKELPLQAVLGGLGVSLVYGLCKGDMYRLLVGVLPGVLLILMGFFTGEKVGYGDGLLVIVIGCVMGWPGSFVVYVIAQFGVLFYAVFLLVAKRAAGNVKVPFVPFLAVALMAYQIGG